MDLFKLLFLIPLLFAFFLLLPFHESFFLHLEGMGGVFLSEVAKADMKRGVCSSVLNKNQLTQLIVSNVITETGE